MTVASAPSKEGTCAAWMTAVAFFGAGDCIGCCHGVVGLFGLLVVVVVVLGYIANRHQELCVEYF